MAQGKKSFIIYTDSRGMVNKLSNERAGILFKTLFSYCDDENPICEDEVIDIVFEHFKNILKRDLKKYEKIVERNRNNGKSGGRPKNPMGNLDTDTNPIKPKKADSDNDNDNVNDIEERKVNFANSLKPYLSIYGKDMLNDFYGYWTEHGEKDKKFRAEKQTSFNIERRLETWKRNDDKFKPQKTDRL